MSSITIGNNNKTGEPVEISDNARSRSLYVVGITGTGKSTLLERIAYQDMENGDGLCFLDPHGRSVDALVDAVPVGRKDDVVYWNTADIDRPFGINPFYCSDPSDPRVIEARQQAFIEALRNIEDFSDSFKGATRMINVLRQLAITFIVNRLTLAETSKFLNPDKQDFRQQFYPALEEYYKNNVLEFWQTHDNKSENRQWDIVESSFNKLEPFTTSVTMRRIFGQATNSINFRQAMDEGKIILVDLSGAGDDYGAYLGAFIVYEIYQAAKSRRDIPEDECRPFHIFADEFQTYMTRVFPDFIAQCRKFKVDVALGHQEREGQLDDKRKKASTRSTGNMVLFRVNGIDARELAGEFDTTPPQPAEERLEQKVVIVPNAIEHIASNGHEKEIVVENYNALVDLLENFFEAAVYWSRENENILTTYKKRMIRGLNKHFYEVMKVGKNVDVDKDEEQKMFKRATPTILGVADDVYGISFADIPGVVGAVVSTTDPIPTFYRQIQRMIEILREDPVGGLSDPELDEYNILHLMEKYGENVHPPGWDKQRSLDDWGHAWKWHYRERGIIYMVVTLSIDLHYWPCYTRGGQLDPVYEKPRPYSDVKEQIANELTLLPKYQARCKLTTETGTREVTIKTLNFTEAVDTKRAERIRDVSRWIYGQPREKVEEEIERRLRTTTEARSATPTNGKEQEPEQDDTWVEIEDDTDKDI